MSEEKAPNVVFVGGKDGREPLSGINFRAEHGAEVLTFPEDQSKPFYTDHLEIVLRQGAGLYKAFDPTDQAETDLPADFPGREIFRASGLNLVDLKGRSKADLLTLNGVGNQTADKVLIYFEANPGE